jgi:gluconokinase
MKVSNGTRDLSPVSFRVVVVMGVSGSGKSTIASMLAARLGCVFVDADWLHPAANVEKMRAGTPLTDADRWPWLQAIAEKIDELHAQGSSAVVACSVLKRAYRDALMGADRRDKQLVYLAGDLATVAGRLHARGGHFMPASLLASQFETLEPPTPDERPIVVSILDTPAAIVDAVATSLRSRAA